MNRALPITLVASTLLAALAGPAARAASTAFPSTAYTAGSATLAAAASVAHPFAAPDMAQGPSPAGFGGLGEVTLALCVVLVAIFGLAWLTRRVRAISGRADALAVLAEVRIGPKERAVLIRVGAAQLLVGVAPGQVNTLHVLPQPVEVGRAPGPASDRPSFRALLLKSLGKP